MELNSPIREEFFRWCDDTVLAAMSSSAMMLNKWRPRKTASGKNYELVFQISAAGEEPTTHVIPIPDKYTELLDQEYPDHSGDEHNEEKPKK